MDFSEIFEWAEQYLKAKCIISLRPHEYIYLLGGCWLRIKHILYNTLTKTLLINVRQDMMRYLQNEYYKGTHSYSECGSMLDMLILPNMTFDILGRAYTFLELEDMVESGEFQ